MNCERSGSDVSSSVSVKSDQSKGGIPNFSEKTPSSIKSVRSDCHISSSVSVKSNQSKGGIPNFSEKTTSSTKRFQYEKSDSDFQTPLNHSNFIDNLLGIFQDLESKIFTFLKNELERFKKILKKNNTQNFVKEFNENRCSIKEAALDLALYFLREMKQNEAADTLEDELVFIHHLKCNLKKKYKCVFEGIAKQGDSILLNNIYTDLYITHGCSEQINTEHEVRQIEVASRRHKSQEIPIECKNLFEASEQDKQIRTVLTKGVAGIGKSVSVQKFVLDWAEGKENQDISFIFPLPFREINLKKEKEKQSFVDLITQFFPETKGLNLTRRNQFKVLFILDGLDECRLPLNFEGNETWSDVSSPASLDVLLTNLIKGNLLPSALIWITTRPAAASKIPPYCIDQVTEIRGFNDTQKEEYFRKRFTDENQFKEIIDHIIKSKSLFIMCHIPVFCWISATVLQNILEEKRNNDLKNNQTDDASKTLQESNTEDTPKTLTQMYTHFLRFQIQQSLRKYDGKYTPDVSWDKDAILSLGKLAFHQLERNNLLFYDTDLEACGIDVYKASVYSGMCTQIFKEETGIILGTMYCFVHLSIQEFIAALYAHLFLDINKKSVFVQDCREQGNKNETMIDLLKTAVDKALESDNGHMDLFLRFLLGLSLQSNRQLLRGLLTQQDRNDQSKKEIVQYIKQKFEANLSPERSINLFYCLNELNDQTLVKEIQTHLNKGSLSSSDLSPAQWSALAFVLLTSKEEMEEFELQKFKKSDECLIRLSAVIKTSKRALLRKCDLTEESCSALASVFSSDSSLKDLDLSNNNLQDSGVKLLSDGLKESCKLEILKLSFCSITEEGYKALASALRSNPSHLKELDLTGNDPGQSGVKELNDLLQYPNCQLKLRLLDHAADEACQYVTGVVGKNLLLLRELNLSEHKLDSKLKQLAALLADKHCKLNKLILNNSDITEENCSSLVSALNSNPSNLKELDLSGSNLRDSGIKIISTLFENGQCRLVKLKSNCIYITAYGCAALAAAFNSNPSNLRELDLSGNPLRDSGVMNVSTFLANSQCTLQILRLSDCSITEEGYKALASALRSNPSHLIELDLTGNDPGQSGLKELNDLLQDPNCQLKKMRFLGPAAYQACQYVKRVMGKNLLLLRELNLSGRELGDTRVNQIAALLQDKHCKLNKLILCGCSITEKQCLTLTSALKSNPSHLRELDLSGNELRNTGVNHLCDVLKDSHCKLERLRLRICLMTDKGCSALTSALKSNPSHLRELELSKNKLGDPGVKNLSDLLMNPQCKLEKLQLSDCSITEEGYKALASALRSNPSHLIELDLTGNDPGQSGVQQLNDLLQSRWYSLKTLRFLGLAAEEVYQYVTGVVSKNPLFLKELDLSERKLGDTQVNQIAALLQDKHCKLNTLILFECSITEKQCLILTSALKSNSLHLRELDLSKNEINTGVNHLCDVLKDSHCKLERLRLTYCYMTDKGCAAMTSALKSNPSHLKVLDLSGNELGKSGVKNLRDLLMNPQFKLEKLKLFYCSITEKQCLILTSALKSNPSHLRELDLSWNKIKNTGVIHLCDILKDSQCKLERLRLRYCDMTEEGCSTLTSALKSNPTHLRELDLSGNKLGDSGVKNLSDLLMNPQCKLVKLDLCGCSITKKQCLILTSALKSNPSHLEELDLSENQIKNTGVNHLCDILKDSQCKLERLSLNDCGITDVSSLTQSLTNTKALQFLKELDLTNNMIGDSKQQLIDVLQDSNCKLR
uniref:NACHT domain-containing protein n=1 Tax=Cyprinus carpio TaxID=7962 RepID=A0A8C2KG60_CYPCA